jgi:glutamate formiminotransferase
MEISSLQFVRVTMMVKLKGKYIESVPNISEGRRKEVVDAIADSLCAVNGIYLLDCSSDEDHNRSVITFAGLEEAVKEGAFALVKKSVELIDLRKHKGSHPRMGATDVLPFVPLGDSDMALCVRIANEVGERIGKELGIPVYLYEHAARKEMWRNLANVRKGEFEGLREEIGKNPERKPDFGPEKIHETAGAIAVGARQFLIAYNVNLESKDVGLAKRIAKRIREKDGGLPAVKALGLFLEKQGCAQISINLVDFTKTGIEEVYKEIERLAEKEGVKIRESELIGLLPQASYSEGLENRVKLRDFTKDRIIEVRLAKMIEQNIKRFREC